ncbi:ABC transporter [Bordetella genomosp. 1]|uniref:ABC transporter n=1 Tax=Bordetella genomosp. 1 TaxID=1395607 RepID=A0A261SPS1_9BORD|nr:ATP-binding cassette domain-containing protein [Bordetella genomosp. 1]OZI39398.1 ABC transporter [Bordetella genomosp. 1]
MNSTPDSSSPLFLALMRLAALQRESVDALALQQAAHEAQAAPDARQALARLAGALRVRAPRWRASPDEASLPALIAAPDGQWGLLRARDAAGQWVSEWFDAATQKWYERASPALPGERYATLRLTPAYSAAQSAVLRLVMAEVLSHRGLLLEAAVGGLVLAAISVLVSFYSMQVYDRVIPTAAYQTLLVLTLGVAVAVLIEYVGKRLRSGLYERVIDAVDQRLARVVYLRFLSVRLDQLPPGVGSLASQLRGYESVRAFLTTLLSQTVVDVPFALLFLGVIALISPWLALIPLVFLVLSLSMALWHAGRIRQLMMRGTAASNLRIGLLVETVEGAEIIKSGQGGWRMLGRWLGATDEARDIDLQMRHLNELAQYRAAAMQQLAYAGIVAGGAWLASQAVITMGAVIACSILSGRILTPITQLGAQISGWANVRASLQGLDQIWRLHDDHHGQEPVCVDTIRGDYRFEQVRMSLRGRVVLDVPRLSVRAGEKVGVIGPVGAGKTTLLRLFSGMYRASEGRILLDDVDIGHLSKPLLAEHVGYLPQEGRLLSGTLRDNLILGLLDPGDEAILAAAVATGLFPAVIAPHPRGLQQEISEGGAGLSGGQRQLVNLTRVFLRKPRVWLLDEPTASLDRDTERGVIAALQRALRPDDTLILISHKPELLRLVDRLVMVAHHQIVASGPRDAVIEKLQAEARKAAPAVPQAMTT